MAANNLENILSKPFNELLNELIEKTPEEGLESKLLNIFGPKTLLMLKTNAGIKIIENNMTNPPDLKKSLRCYAFREQAYRFSRSVLHLAAKYGNLNAIEEIIQKGVAVDTLCFLKGTALMDAAGSGQSNAIGCNRRNLIHAALGSWRMDETYLKMKGQWHYLYRAVDKFGKTIDFYLSKIRDKKAAKCFFYESN